MCLVLLSHVFFLVCHSHYQPFLFLLFFSRASTVFVGSQCFLSAFSVMWSVLLLDEKRLIELNRGSWAESIFEFDASFSKQLSEIEGFKIRIDSCCSGSWPVFSWCEVMYPWNSGMQGLLQKGNQRQSQTSHSLTPSTHRNQKHTMRIACMLYWGIFQAIPLGN